MGRPIFTEPIMADVHSMEELDSKVNGDEFQVRRWCQADRYPEEDEWWTEKELFVETFLEPITTSAAHQTDEAHSTMGPVADPSVVNERENASEASNIELPSREQQEEAMEVDEVVIPVRYTISEEELANTSLDIRMDTSSDDDDDFELAWDPSDDYEDSIAFDLASLEPHSDASTPAPSTPILETSSLPVSVPSSPDTTHRRSLFTTPLKATSSLNKEGAFSLSSTKLSGRSVTRVPGFVAHSPRLELVL